MDFDILPCTLISDRGCIFLRIIFLNKKRRSQWLDGYDIRRSASRDRSSRLFHTFSFFSALLFSYLLRSVSTTSASSTSKRTGRGGKVFLPFSNTTFCHRSTRAAGGYFCQRSALRPPHLSLPCAQRYTADGRAWHGLACSTGLSRR